MPLLLPEIPEAEDSPLVRQLVEIIRAQHERIQQLEDEIARLKGLKTRPVIAPSRLETPPRPPLPAGQKRPGSLKRSKTAELVITEEVFVPVPNLPRGRSSRATRTSSCRIWSCGPSSPATAANAGRPPTARPGSPRCRAMSCRAATSAPT